MLDGLLKSKFYTKCKGIVKLTKTRVETIKKKKMAVQKFLKSDIADLLRNGLDMNAYGRAEGLLIEQNMTRCYELVESFCSSLSTNLSLMEKQKECPEECREAAASLVYAAARFSDLPELRDLRNMLEERFGKSLETYTNSEFMERLSTKTYTKEIKLQLLQDVAHELAIEWDSKALEQQLFTPPTPQLNQGKNTDIGGQEKNVTQSRRSPQQGTKSQASDFRKSREDEEDDDEFSVTDFSQDGSDRKTSSSSEDDSDIPKTSSRGGLRPPPYLLPKPEKPAPAQEDKSPIPRSVRQRNINNNNKNSSKLPLPPGRVPDPEESAIDDLLMHYSNKKPNYDAATTGRYVRGRRSELAMPPGRVASMPPEQGSSPAARGPTRAASLGGLPGDYDELAARIAALRGK